VQRARRSGPNKNRKTYISIGNGQEKNDKNDKEEYDFSRVLGFEFLP
jgi:hypothetical protein